MHAEIGRKKAFEVVERMIKGVVFKRSTGKSKKGINETLLLAVYNYLVISLM